MEEIYRPVLVGQEDNRKIFMEYGEYLKIIKFAKAGASDGCRGVLLGKNDGQTVYVYKALEAVYSGDEELETPVFSTESWGRISSEFYENYSDLEILGQFSSHWSVSPSRTDYIMQDKFFDRKSNLLFVFDPTSNSEKFYIYDSCEFCFLNGFYLFDRYDNPIDLKIRESVVRPLCREYELRMRIFDDIKKKMKRQNHIYAAIVLVITLLIVFLVYFSYALEKRIDSLTDREKTEWNSE